MVALMLSVMPHGPVLLQQANMSQQIGKLQTLTGGISTISTKLGPANSFAWGRSINFRSDPAQQTTYPQTKKISGSIVTLGRGKK